MTTKVLAFEFDFHELKLQESFLLNKRNTKLNNINELFFGFYTQIDTAIYNKIK